MANNNRSNQIDNIGRHTLGSVAAIGIGVGTALGVSLDNYAVGFSVGLALALALYHAKK
ncbi:hypothetical protein HR060_04970 [Catenovulum sp. SM1970]|uniref:hypothetical protein n=1 Tax=Marinifaba aquimaris TaxID=2741323 RepID=UPI001573648E|nr:hypothetical protein [Marinifaba aquimaris]NTS76213.1 hypothetical protein [Marinifaba aquimaris]